MKEFTILNQLVVGDVMEGEPLFTYMSDENLCLQVHRVTESIDNNSIEPYKKEVIFRVTVFGIFLKFVKVYLTDKLVYWVGGIDDKGKANVQQ